jgi:hypothetical protein
MDGSSAMLGIEPHDNLFPGDGVGYVTVSLIQFDKWISLELAFTSTSITCSLG